MNASVEATAIADSGPELSVLSWCAGEIRQSLQTAGESLRRQLQAGPDDTSALRAAGIALHQAHGALSVVGLSGVQVLTGEGERLLDAFGNGSVELTENRASAFARACGALAEYLDGLLAGDPHQPMYLFPYYRDLAFARGVDRVSPADLLVLSPGNLPALDPERQTDAGALVVARAAFERGLLRLLREPADKVALQAMHGAVDAVLHSPRGRPQAAFWQAALGCFEAWRDGALALDVHGKRLLARINLQMRHTQAEGAPVAARLLSETLFVLAGAKGGSPLVRSLREAWSLDGAIPDDYEMPRYGLIDERARDAARAALSEARNAWATTDGGPVAASERLRAGQALVDATATLPLGGLHALARALLTLAHAAASPEREADESLGLEAATALLFAEQMFERGLERAGELNQRIDEFADRLYRVAAGNEPVGPMPDWILALGHAAQERSTIAAFVAETRTTLQSIEQVLDIYFRDATQAEGLPAAAAQLRQVGGALRMLGELQAGDDAIELAERVASFAASASASGSDDARAVAPPTHAELEALATKLGSLGFFVDSLLAPGRASPEVSAADADSRPVRARAAGLDSAMPAVAVDAGGVDAVPHADDGVLSQIAAPSGVTSPSIVGAAELAAVPSQPSVELPLVGSIHEPTRESAEDAPDPELLEIFLGEAEEVLDAILQGVGRLRDSHEDIDALTAIRRGFHTLKGSGRMVGLNSFGEAAWAMEQLLNLWLAEARSSDADLLDLIELAAARFGGWVAVLREQPRTPIDPDAVIAAAHAVRDGGQAQEALAALLAAGGAVTEIAADAVGGEAVGIEDSTLPETWPETEDAHEAPLPGYVGSGGDIDAGTQDESAATMDSIDSESEEVAIGAMRLSRPLYEIFVAESDELLSRLFVDLEAWGATPARGATEIAQRSMHSLKGSSAVVSLFAVQTIAEQLEAFLLRQRVSGRSASPQDLSDYAEAIGCLRSMLDRFAGGVMPQDEPAVLALATQLAARWDTQRASRRMPTAETGDLDLDLLPLFLEEATDILPQIGENLRGWHAQPGDRALQQLVMRQLHTVKGSARMAGAMVLGQRVHEMETRVEATSGLSVVPSSLIEELIVDHDDVVEMFEAIRDPEAAAARASAASLVDDDASAADDRIGAPIGDQVGDSGPATGQQAVDDQFAFESDAEAIPSPVTSPSSVAIASQDAEAAAAKSAPGIADPFVDPASAAPLTGTPLTYAGTGGSPLVRVRADLLDRIVNESGEVSISRSRLDNELAQLRQALQELTENVGRLRTQLREIEIQSESQVQARIAHQRDGDADFDPLEFDRYTRFQELTRMLAESVNDVATVQQNAMRSLDGAAQDMIRQGQVLRELQQNLMRMRMVQFGSISDRLYRVVRQAAKELGKRVSMDMRGSSVEVDRGVLERMAAPIEHLLRNAVAHGIEPPSTRASAGKAETGEIRVEVRQEGNEVVLVFADDGGGLDTARIVRKARANGLIPDGGEVPEREAAELIFKPGFSTADAIDEISGRGVGLDVVRAEVDALGGRIETDWTPGAGTRFTVHLPLTLAIAQVVLVGAGTQKYAIPASSVEQVLQLKPPELAAAYTSGRVAWQGSELPIQFLGLLVGLQDVKPVAQHRSPIIVIRSGNQRIAVHADAVSPTQEVVVKNVGPQVARVRGVGGATVLGNGEIVLILNAVRLAQAVFGEDGLARGTPSDQVASLSDVPPTVMVVDDSLTVRKVTQRLLSREGYDVMLAKDGVDALRQLQDRRPDLMLVDIEMPRMDGFDLTRNLRGDERYRGIPIVMITSRTADKHRNYAMSLGVDVFLGKPYRDDELLQHVAAFTRERVARAG